MIASEGPAVDTEVANAAPIINLAAPDPGPQLNSVPVPGLPPELQPAPGDILLNRAFWPWADLGARDIPESWLYMSRRVQGVIAQMAVQTPAGPKLVNANADGSLNIAAVVNGGVTINGTPTVQFSAGQQVQIQSGTVNVQTAADVSVQVQAGQISLGPVATQGGGGTLTTNLALPAGVQAIVIDTYAWQTATHLKVVGHVSGIVYWEQYFFPYSGVSQTIGPVFPVLYIRDSTIDVTLAASNTLGIAVLGLLTSVPEFLEYYRPPWAFPNQLPAEIENVNIAAAGYQVLVAPVANVKISVFDFIDNAGQALLRHGTAGNDANSSMLSIVPPNVVIPLRGLVLSAGEGIWLKNTSGGAVVHYSTLTYSLS